MVQAVDTFNYTGTVQVWTAPTGCYSVTILARGGEGGRGSTELGAYGAQTQAFDVPVVPGEQLKIRVGQKGRDYDQSNGAGGSPNGGSSVLYNSGTAGGGGGGSSDVRRAADALSDQIIVAGGGGGGSSTHNQYSSSPPRNVGAGGGPTGVSGSQGFSGASTPGGGGGTQSVGGAGGGNYPVGNPGGRFFGGAASNSDPGLYTPAGGGGGGGYYGGGAGGPYGAAYSPSSGGGGGSSYLNSPGGGSYVEGTYVQVPGNGIVTLTYEWNPAPYAPSLLAPANGITTDLNNGGTFDWSFNDEQTGDAQTAYALRRKIGVGAYEYWNASTSTWQAGEVKNVTATTEVVFGAGKWTVGNTYNWSIKTWDSEDNAGPYASDFTVGVGTAPAVNITAPTTTAATAKPLVSWAFSDADGHSQQSFIVKIFSQAIFSGGGFDPEMSATVYNSGTVVSAASSHLTATALNNGGVYRVYVKATDSTGQVSPWDFEEFTVSFVSTATPTMSLLAHPDTAKTTVQFQGHDNMLTVGQANIETDVSELTPDAGTTLVHVAGTGFSGTGYASLQNTSGGVGSVAVKTLSPKAPAIAGRVYTAMAYIKNNTTTRTGKLHMDWYTSADALISSVLVDTKVESTGNWVQLLGSMTAPANAAYVIITVIIESTSNNEIHYLDGLYIGPDPAGVVTSWSRGGAAAIAQFKLERSVDGGSTWQTVRNTPIDHDGAASQEATVDDFEAPNNVVVLYRASSTAEV